MERYLYRGANSEFHDANDGMLLPKTNDRFEYVYKHDGTIKYDGSAKYGNCEHNAVLRHELNQEGFPTSGISTTPIKDRAKFYALGGSKFERGYIYKIDRELLKEYRVKEYIVAEWIKSPSIPEDKEVILVADNDGALPKSIVVEIFKVKRK